MIPRHSAILVLALAFAAALAGLARDSESAPRSSAVEIVLSVNTAELPGNFKSPWQVAWIAGGSKQGTLAFTDRGGNQVGLLDPVTGRTQAIPLTVITNPNPIAIIDQSRFAIAGTGGVGIFDRSGTGTVRELQMPGTRNTVLAVGANSRLFVADAQSNDLRIIRPPYGGPADITKFPLPAQCRGPTGVIPEASRITLLCQQTNNVVTIDYTGNFGSSTTLPVANAGAQEARPSPNGFVFSGFNANRFFSFSAGYTGGFKSYALTGPAVPTVGHFHDPAFDKRLAQAATQLRAGRKPARAFFFNSFTPSYRNGSFSFGSFPAATSNAYTRLAGRNLVGSTVGPGGSIWVADATPGRPALHRISFVDPKAARTQTGYRYRGVRLTQVNPDFLARMSMPFFSAIPPREVRAHVTGASASPWNLKPTFSRNFNLKVTARGTLRTGGTYAVKTQSGDTGAYGRAYRFFGFRPNTRSLTLTLAGHNEIPASFKVDAVAPTSPCECDSLDVELRNNAGAGFSELTLGFDWTLECTGGAGACEAGFSVSGDKAARAAGVKVDVVGSSDKFDVQPSGNEIQVTCKGDCTGPTAPGPRGAYLIVKAPPGQAFSHDIRSVSIVVERTCRRPLAPKIFRIAFGANGLVSDRRSDLNGNGVPDGQ